MIPLPFFIRVTPAKAGVQSQKKPSIGFASLDARLRGHDSFFKG